MTSLRYALRSLGRSRGFVIISVLALALGLGLSTTMFAVLDAVVNPYNPYRNVEELHSVRWWAGARNAAMSPSDLYSAVRSETSSFAQVVPFSRAVLMLETDNNVGDIQVGRVTPAYFELMGARPSGGRFFDANDEDRAAVVSEALFKSVTGFKRFRPGHSIRLGDRTWAVVGTMPRGFTHLGSAWIPLPTAAGNPGAFGSITPLVRLRPGVAPAAAAEELHSLAQLLTDRHAARTAPYAFELQPVQFRREEVRDIHIAMVGAAVVVLIIACVNLAHLMLARGLGKRREFAVRMAVGATRANIVRQMFTECLIITGGGAIFGALAALWGTWILRNRMPPSVSWIGILEPQLSWRVFALSAAAAILAAIAFGLIPAIRIALGVSLDEPLKDGAGTTARARQRYSPLVVLETALALVLLMSGGLLLRTVWLLQAQDPGFETRTLLQAFVGARRADSLSAAARMVDVVSTARGTAGVSAVALTGNRPLRGGAVTAEMVVGDSTRTITRRDIAAVSPEFFRVLGLPILRGRDFEPGDAMGDGAVIIDVVAEAQLYPGQDAVGKMVKLGAPASDAPWLPIIGVARYAGPPGGNAPRTPGMWTVQPATRPRGMLLIRTERQDPRITADLQRRLRSLPGVTGTFVFPFDQSREAAIASRGFLAKVFVVMGSVALALSALGLYGVLAYAVGQRMREFAVRIALGASPSQLLHMVMHDGAVMLLAGTGVGAFAALAATRYVDSVIEGVFRTDAWTLVSAEALLLTVGLAAALVPARRALKANPLDVLRAI